jgi:protein SCO1
MFVTGMIRSAPILFILFLLCMPSSAGLSPRQLSQANLAPLPGAQLPIETSFVPETGIGQLTLADAIAGKPAALILVDYTCRFVCGTTLAIAATGLSETGLIPGKDFSFVVIGIDPKDSPSGAAAMMAAQLAPYPALTAAAHFLSGNEAAIGLVTQALNYTPIFDAERGEYAHPVGVIILTGNGRVSRLIGGLDLQGLNLRSALIDARESKVSSLIEGIRLLCYGHEPLHGVFNAQIQSMLLAFGLTTVAAIGGMIAYLVGRKGQHP